MTIKPNYTYREFIVIQLVLGAIFGVIGIAGMFL